MERMNVARWPRIGRMMPVLSGVAYLATACLSLTISRGTAGLAALWPSNAILLSALLLAPRRHHGRYVIACTVASLIANLMGGVAVPNAVLFTATDILSPFAAALVLRATGTGADAFDTFPGIGRLLAALGIAVATGATLVSAAIAARGGDFTATWIAWAASDYLGTLLVTPVILTAARVLSGTRSLRRRTFADVAWPLAIILCVTTAVFAQSRFPMLFLPLAVLMIATYRLGLIGAVLGTIIIAGVGTAFQLFDLGPIALVKGTEAVRVQFFQFYLGVLFATCLPLATALAESDRLSRERVEHERQHRRILERSREVIFETDLDGRWTYLNPAWHALTGHDADASIGRSFLSFILPDDRADALARLEPLYACAIDECRQEVRYCHADDEIRWAAVRSQRSTNADGDVVGTHGTIHDITNRKAAEAAQRESERLYRLLADNSNDMIVRLSLQGVRNYVSPASRALLGYEPHEMIGASPAGEIHPDDRANAILVCRSLLEGAADPICVYRQRRKDGRYAWLEATYRLIRDENGNPAEFIASVRDVSRRQVAELESADAAARLRESHRLLLLAEAIGEIGHWRVDLASGTVFWSDAVCAIHGREPGYVPELATAIELYHPDDREAVAALVERALTTGEDFEHRARIIRPDGSVREVASRGRAEVAPHGGIVGLFGVFQDVTHVHEADLALRESEARYKMLADHATDIVLRLGADGECLFISPSAFEITGLAPADLLGRPLSDRIHDDDREQVRETARLLRRAAGPSMVFEFRFRHHDGHWIWLEANLRASADAITANVTNLIGSIRAIDRRKEAELLAAQASRQLAESNRMLTMAEAVAHLGHWRIDHVNSDHFWSDEVYRIHGIDPAVKPTFQNALDTYHPDDVPFVRKTVEDALATGQGYAFRARVFRPDGTLVHVFIRGEADRDAQGRVKGLFGIVQDVTEQAEVEALLKERESRFRLITEQASDMISLHDIKGRCMFMSPSSLTILGHDPAALIGKTANDLAPPEDHAVLKAHHDRLLSGALGNASSARFRMRRSDGTLAWIEAAARLAEYEGQTCTISVSRDITHQVATERELQAARVDAEAAVNAKSSFLATMSHEIRTPMTGVLGMIELLRADVDPVQRDRFFDRLEQSARTLMTVLDDVLDYSKIESGNLVLETISFDLATLAHNVIELFMGAASGKGLTLTLDAPVAGTMVMGDPTRIQQVLSNLVSNAIKFTQTGGIRLTLAGVPLDSEHTRWRIEVADTGIGIDGATSETLFSPFVQADLSTTRRFGGSGLGLTISKRLVTAMGGAIGAVPRAPGGSLFWFELPMAASRADAPPTPRATPRRGTKHCTLRVLVAEDNSVNQLLITALVKRLGHTVTCVTNGQLAVDRVASERFDVILMDMQMPVMDGIAATRAIRGTGATLPIIALTADALPERRRFYENIGLTDFLTKPIDIARLTAVLDDIVPQSAEISPALDQARIEQLREDVGEDVLVTLLDMLVSEAAHRPAVVTALLRNGDGAGAAREAHALRGASANVGAYQLAAAAAAVEQAPDLATMEQRAAQLADAAHALVTSLTTSRSPSASVAMDVRS